MKHSLTTTGLYATIVDLRAAALAARTTARSAATGPAAATVSRPLLAPSNARSGAPASAISIAILRSRSMPPTWKNACAASIGPCSAASIDPRGNTADARLRQARSPVGADARDR